MASNKRNDDEFKLPLRPWLRKKIDQGKFKGLEWLNKESQIFKISWTQKGHPGWQEHYEVFRAWAKHRGNYDEDSPPDDNRLKGNFRCVLNKSEDFFEIKEKNITDQQMGNYKVFQILSPSLVKAAKAKKRKSSQPKGDDTQSISSSAKSKQKRSAKDIQDQKYPVPQSIETSVQSISNVALPSVFWDEPEPVHAVEKESKIVTSEQNTEIPGLTTLDSYLLSDQCTALDAAQSSVIFISGTQVNSLDLPPIATEDIENVFINDYIHPITPLCEADETLLQDAAGVCQQMPTVDSLQEFLNKSKLSESELAKFSISLSYGETIVACQEPMDLSQARRVLYGNATYQNDAIVASGITLDDFNLPTWEFPSYSGKDETIWESLNLADQGIVLSVEERGVLYGKRLCQSRVWMIRDTEEPVKMTRKDKTELFSYSKYIQKLLSDKNHQSSWKIELIIGEKPPAARIHLVSMIIEPVLGPFVESFFSKRSNSSSLCYSSEASIDKVIRLFNKQSLLNEKADL